MIVRDEEARDRLAVRAVNEAAFARSAEADLTERLHREGACVFSLVAVEGDAVVGHVMFSRMMAPFRALGLGPIAVLPARQGSGIASSLIREGLARARATGWEGVFVLGAPLFYQRFGFDPALARGFTSPFAGAHLMVLALGAALPATSGVIDYAPAFE
jgi:putative acetyltransferase